MPDDTPSPSFPPLRPVESDSADNATPLTAKELRAQKLARAREEARAAARARARAAATQARLAALRSGAGVSAPDPAPPQGPAAAPDLKPSPDAQEPREGRAPHDAPAAPRVKPPAKPRAKPPAKGGAKAPGKPSPKRATRKSPQGEIEDATILPPARPSHPRARHRMVAFAFLLMVLAPLGAAAWYLWERAADQYVSELGFTVRREETATPTDFLGGLSGLSSAGSSDTDVLYEYIQSQELVRLVDEDLDLRGRFSAYRDTDPIFAFNPEGSIEDLVAYWRRMVQISYNPGSGMLDLRVFAFAPREAQEIAEAILQHSSRVINDLSAIAREDATRYARADLTQAQDDLKAAREALTAFRSRTRIIDPTADLQGQMGLLNTLEGQLAAALIDLDLLRETTREGDPRINQALRRVEVIEARIEDERSKFGQGFNQGSGAPAVPGSADYATLVAEFERLSVEREFAEQAYIAALGAFTSARAEAERQSRYLAAYVRPTLAETTTRPQKLLLMGLAALFLTLAWAIAVLIYYSLRDRQ